MALHLFHVTPVADRTLLDAFPQMPRATAKILYCEMKTCKTSADVDWALDLANFHLGGHGVESIKDDGWEPHYLDIGLLYVNMGDPYKPTLMFDTRTVRFLVGNWGDYIERHARRFAEA